LDPAVYIVIALALVWAAVLIPPILRDRAQNRVHSVGDFSKRLRALQPHRGHSFPSVSRRAPVTVSSPRPTRVSSQAARRRREVLWVLGGAFVVTFLVGFNLNGAWWGLFALSALLLFGYIAALANMAGKGQGRSSDLDYYADLRPARPAPEYAYRRSASN
jgi:hypothetical protein